MDWMDVSEADECAANKATALANLQEQVSKGETMGVIAMYERAALRAGASSAEVDAALRAGKAGQP